MPKCGYNEAWVGDCKTEVPNEGDRCEKHANEKCVSCGAPATHSCAETFQFVCGAPLCNDCEHTIAKDGTNGGCFSHCKKSEQVNKPWYQNAEKENP